MKYNDETINYFVNLQDANGWSGTALKILQYVTKEVNENDPEWYTTIELQYQIEKKFQILIEQVEIKILKQIYNEYK
tara:strand:+ start:210 stop:440 length:231 start_codon:yes stop_codon:yes gene_type:complete